MQNYLPAAKRYKRHDAGCRTILGVHPRLQKNCVHLGQRRITSRTAGGPANTRTTMAVKEALAPPGPKGQFYIGSLRDLRNRPLEFMEDCVASFGDITHFQIATIQAYLL